MGSKADARDLAARSPVINNRKALFRFEVIETVECGIVLTGGEVKSLREGKAHLDESYAKVRGTEIWLATKQNYLPVRILVIEKDGTRIDQVVTAISAQ